LNVLTVTFGLVFAVIADSRSCLAGFAGFTGIYFTPSTLSGITVWFFTGTKNFSPTLTTGVDFLYNGSNNFGIIVAGI